MSAAVHSDHHVLFLPRIYSFPHLEAEWVLRCSISQTSLPSWLWRELLRVLHSEPNRWRWARLLRHEGRRGWHRWHRWHGRHWWWALTKSSGLRLESGWEEAVDAGSLRVKRRRLEGVEARGLRLHGLERRARWIGEGAAVLLGLEILLEACLHRLLEAGLHGLLEAGLHWLLETSLHGLLEASLLGHLRRGRHGVVACGLGHHASLLVSKPSVLWHAIQLLLQAVHWHLLHIRLISSKLGLQRCRRAKGTLLWVLRGGRGSLWRWCDHTASTLLLRRLWAHAWRGKVLWLRQSLDSSDLVEERRRSTSWLSLLRRSRCWLGSYLWLLSWSRRRRRSRRSRLGDELWLQRRHVQKRQIVHGSCQFRWLRCGCCGRSGCLCRRGRRGGRWYRSGH